MKCKKLVSLFLSLLLATALAVPACAAFEDVFADGSADGTRDGSLFLSGETVRSGAAVNGVLLAAGKTVGVSGAGAYVMAAGYEVTLGGTAENDAFLAGYSIGVNGAAQRDVFAAGQSITVNGTVGRDLYAAANTVTITGSVGGDVYVSAESVVIGDGAEIGGRLHCNASALRSVPDGIADSAELYDEPESGDVGVSITVPDDEPGVGSIVLRKALSFAGVLLLAFVLLWLTPLWETVDRKYYGAPFGRYAKAFGIGFAVLAGVPLAAILLFISNVGVRLALIVLFLYAAAIIAAPVFLGFFLGALLWRGAEEGSLLLRGVGHRYPRLARRGQCARSVLCGEPRLRAARPRRCDAPARQGRGEAVAQGGDGLRGVRGVRPRSAAGGQRQRGAISPCRTAKRDRSGGLFLMGT